MRSQKKNDRVQQSYTFHEAFCEINVESIENRTIHCERSIWNNITAIYRITPIVEEIADEPLVTFIRHIL